MAFGSVCATRGLHLCGAHSSLAVNITKKSNNLRRKFGLTPSTVDRELGTRARAALGGYPDTDHCSSGNSLRAVVKTAFNEAAKAALRGEISVDVSVTECSNAVNGDYQCNSAMSIYSELKRQGNTRFTSPRSLAETIVKELPDNNGLFDDASVAGPGFINVSFSTSSLASRVQMLIQDSDVKASFAQSASNSLPKRAVVDYSSPNIAKEMHVGHLRSTIIGETICRALESFGVEVVRLNHVGDWGTQFGMLLTHLEDNSMRGGCEIKDLQAFYKESKIRFDKDEEFKERSQLAVVKLQSGDPVMIRMWREICEISRKDFEDIYKMLGISLTERGESYYNDVIPIVLNDLVNKNIAIESDGALCIFENEDEPPLICRKSDGGFNYASTDLAALWQRVTKLKAEWVIYVTDIGQRKHFEAVFNAAKRAGWLTSSDETKSVRLDHVGFGLVLDENGKRFRTRSGETVPLKALLYEAQARCLKTLQARGSNLSADDMEEAARIMGMAAVKYADLQNNRLTNYSFSYDRMLDMKGNTAVYLLYTHTRISSILCRAEDKDLKTYDVDENALKSEKERALAIAILKFPDALDSLVQELLPSRLCDYAYYLCVAFNESYSSCKVIGSDEEKTRLVLCQGTALSLRKAMYILGIEPLNKL